MLSGRSRSVSFFEDERGGIVDSSSDPPSTAPVELLVVDLDGVPLLDMGGFTSELRERFKGRGGNTVKLAAVVRDRGGDVAKRAQELGWAAVLETPLKQDSLNTAVTCMFQDRGNTPSCCRVSGSSKDCSNSPPENSASEPAPPVESSTDPLPNGNSAVGVLAGKRILVVDDAMINRRVASRMLERYGCAVVCAASGQEAIDVFREYLATLAGAEGEAADRYHAILMDVQMPGMVSGRPRSARSCSTLI